MARSRNIKPGFFKNSKLADCGKTARLLFAGLWCHADRDGRLEDRPRELKAEIFPFDEDVLSADVNNDLDRLESAKFIIRYSILEEKYIQIINFPKHQNPHIKEQPSTIPAPDKHQTSPVISGTSRADSLLPITDSLNPISTAANAALHDVFEDAWILYPKRSGGNSKKDAQKAWNARIKEGVSPDTILVGIARYGSYCESTGIIGTEFVMQAKRFFGPSQPFNEEWSKPKERQKTNGRKTVEDYRRDLRNSIEGKTRKLDHVD